MNAHDRYFADTGARVYVRVVMPRARRTPNSRHVGAAMALVSVFLFNGCRSGPAGSAEPAVTRSRYVASNLPSGAVGLYVEGRLARAAGDEDRALALLTRAAGDDRLILVNESLGEIYRDRGDLPRSEQFFRRLIARDAGEARGYVMLGQVLELGQRLGEALEMYMAGLQIRPDDADGNLGAGRVLVELERSDEAVPYLQTAVETAPQNAEAWSTLGESLSNGDDLESAEQAFRTALELVPPDAPEGNDLRMSLGMVLARQGRGAEAVPLLDAAAEAMQTADAFKLAGDALATVGNGHLATGDRASAAEAYAQAITRYDSALSLQPEFVFALNAKGAALIQQWQAGGRIETPLRDQAIATWQASLAIDPDQPRVAEAMERFQGAGILD